MDIGDKDRAQCLHRPALLLSITSFGQTHSIAALTDYDLVVSLAPATHELAVDATIELPETQAGETIEFLLMSGLTIMHSEPPVTRLPRSGGEDFQSINGFSVDFASRAGISRYRKG